MKILEPKKRRVANDKFCCLKVDDIFKFVLVPGALDEYEDDDEDFVDDEEEEKDEEVRRLPSLLYLQRLTLYTIQ